MQQIVCRPPGQCVHMRFICTFASKEHSQIMETFVPLEVMNLRRMSIYFYHETNLFIF